MNSSNSKRISIAAISLVAVVLLLSVFSVLVYNSKRTPDEDINNELNGNTSNAPIVTQSDVQKVSDGDVSSQEPVSSENPVESVVSDVSSEVDSKVSSDIEKNKNEYILNPDYKSEYYMVVYTKSQTIMVYQKDKRGGYTVKFKSIKCSTGDLDATPTKEGVYRIEKKERWTKTDDGTYVQFGCLIAQDDGYFISSVPYKEKKASTMINTEYDKIGEACSKGNIQMCVRDARWVYVNMPVGTQLSVVNQEGPDVKNIPSRKTGAKYSGWDPSDKWSKGNPYFPVASSTNSTTTTTAADNMPVG